MLCWTLALFTFLACRALAQPGPPYSLTVSLPAQQVPVNKAIPIAATSNDYSGTDLPVQFNFNCNGQTFSTSGFVNQEASVTFDSVYGGYDCTVYASGAEFIDSSAISFSLLVECEFEGSLTGWQGGSAVVDMAITTPNAQPFPLTFNVRCRTISQSFPIEANRGVTLLLDGSLNGVECLLFTGGLPDNYLPMKLLRVAIAMSSEMRGQVLQQLGLNSFDDAEVGGTGGTGGDGGAGGNGGDAGFLTGGVIGGK